MANPHGPCGIRTPTTSTLPGRLIALELGRPRQAIAHRAPEHALYGLGLLPGRDVLLPAPLLLRSACEVAIGHAPGAPLRGDVVDRRGELRVAGTLRPLEEPLELGIRIARVRGGGDRRVDVVVSRALGGPDLRLLDVTSGIRVGG